MNKNLSDNQSVNEKLKQGFIWTSLSNIVYTVLQFFSLVILSRYISINDFAIMGILMFFLSLSTLVIDSGLGSSVIAKKNVKDIDYSTLFVFNISVSTTLYLIVLLISSKVENFYNIENLGFFLNILSVIFFTAGFNVVQTVIQYRNLKYKESAFINIFSSTFSFGLAIYLAVNNYGVWSLVFQSISKSFIETIMQTYLNRYIPSFRFSIEIFKEQWRFGSHLLFSRILSVLYNNTFILIFPKISDLQFSGLFFQANRIKQLPTNIFTGIIDRASFPIMSKIDNLDDFLEINRSLNRKIYFITFSVFIYLSIFSNDLVVILLGKSWMQAGDILQIISISGLFLIIYSTILNMLKSLSKTSHIFFIELFNFSIGILILFIVHYISKNSILWGIVIASVLSVLLSSYILSKLTKYKIKLQIYDISLILKILITPTVLCIIFNNLNLNLSSIYILILGGVIFLISLILPHFYTIKKYLEIQ